MTEIAVIDPSIIKRLEAIPTGPITDGCVALGVGGWLDEILPFKPEWRFVGRVRTLKYAPRSGVVRSSETPYSAVRRCAPGDVLVMAVGGARPHIIGDNLAHHASYQGLKALVSDGGARDVNELRKLDFPIFARRLSIRPPFGEMAIMDADVPVECGGAHLRPGDVIVGDCDGVLTIPAEVIADVVLQAEHIVAVEKEQAQAIREKAPLDEIAKVIAGKKVRQPPRQA